MKSFARTLLLLPLLLYAGVALAFSGYDRGNGGYYKTSDGSGPYAIDSSGVATLLGSGGGGGGGAVTQSGTWTVQPGNTANTTPWLWTTTTATPAGTNIIGKTGIDQTTPGTTNKVSIGTDGTVGITGTVPLSTGAATEATLANVALDASVNALAAPIHSSVMYATPSTSAGVPFETDAPGHYPSINKTMSTSAQDIVPARTPGTDTRHGLELQFIGTAGYVYCAWGADATISFGGFGFRLDPTIHDTYSPPILPNGPPQVRLSCIGSTSPAVAGSIVGTEYYK